MIFKRGRESSVSSTCGRFTIISVDSFRTEQDAGIVREISGGLLLACEVQEGRLQARGSNEAFGPVRSFSIRRLCALMTTLLSLGGVLHALYNNGVVPRCQCHQAAACAGPHLVGCHTAGHHSSRRLQCSHPDVDVLSVPSAGTSAGKLGGRSRLPCKFTPNRTSSRPLALVQRKAA